MSESAIVAQGLMACASQNIQVLDPRYWSKSSPPPFIGTDPMTDGLVWRNNVGAMREKSRFVRFGLPGSPDLMGILRGGYLFGLECKTDTGKPSKYQLWYKDYFQAFGMRYSIIRSYEEAVAVIQGWKYDLAIT